MLVVFRGVLRRAPICRRLLVFVSFPCSLWRPRVGIVHERKVRPPSGKALLKANADTPPVWYSTGPRKSPLPRLRKRSELGLLPDMPSRCTASRVSIYFCVQYASGPPAPTTCNSCRRDQCSRCSDTSKKSVASPRAYLREPADIAVLAAFIITPDRPAIAQCCQGHPRASVALTQAAPSSRAPDPPAAMSRSEGFKYRNWDGAGNPRNVIALASFRAGRGRRWAQRKKSRCARHPLRPCFPSRDR